MSLLARLITLVDGGALTAASMNAELNSILAALNARVHTDGTAPMTGALLLPNVAPTAANHAARKSYVDGLITAHVAAGGHGSASGGDTIIRKTVNEANASNSTPQDDDVLFFAGEANKVYKISVFLSTNDNNQGSGVRFNIAGPAGMTHNSRLMDMNNGSGEGVAAAPNVAHWTQANTAGNSALSGYGSPPAVGGLFVIDSIVAMGATAGNVRVQWSSQAVVAAPVTVRAGSFLSYRAIN